MQKWMLCVLLLLATAGFADNIVLDNQTAYPAQNAKMMIQWASSAKEVDEGNQSIIYGGKLKSGSLLAVKRQGESDIKLPNSAAYFRVLVWSKGQDEPDLITNWVDVVPEKTYMLKADHLAPSVLMLGTGC